MGAGLIEMSGTIMNYPMNKTILQICPKYKTCSCLECIHIIPHMKTWTCRKNMMECSTPCKKITSAAGLGLKK